MDTPKPLRTVTARALAATALVFGLVGCGTGQPTEAASEAGANGESTTQIAEKLNEAQMSEFGNAKLLAEQSEVGAYSELTSVQQMDALRGSVKLDKPQCMDAVNQWGQLPEVRDAPTSLATFGSGGETITHMLIKLPEAAAKKAIETAPPAECGTYQATAADGVPTTYTVRDLDIDTIGEQSRAFVVETEMGGQQVLLYNLIYRNGDYLGTTALLSGPEGEQRLVDFTTAALEHETKILD